MNAKSGEQKLGGKQDIFRSQMISPKLFINSKGEKSNITMEKPSRHHVYQVIWIKQDISTSGNLWHDKLQEHIISVAFLPKTHTLILIRRKDETNTNYQAFYKITNQYYSKASQ